MKRISSNMSTDGGSFYITSLLLQILDENGEISYFRDSSRDTQPRSWMSYINNARNEAEQNLEVFQIGLDIYYKATKV